jgi:hypothetical protein
MRNEREAAMHLPMNSRSSSLPKCFPIGAKYVVEGHSGEGGDLRVWSRYVVLPSGRRINVPADLEPARSPRVFLQRRNPGKKFRSHAKARPLAGRKKIIGRAGTARQHGR